MISLSSPFISQYANYFYNALSTSIAPGALLTYLSILLSLIVFVILISIVIFVFSYLFSWAERKIIARIQSRRGPTYVGKFGILQNLADLIKLLSKESIIPKNSNKILFRVVLPILVAAFFLMIMFVPLTSTFVGISASLGLLIIFMILSLTPILVFLSGWSSGNKFSSIGAQRSVLMLLSYEIPLLIVVAAVVLLAHSYNLNNIVAAQSGHWFILLMPIGFVIFFIIMLGEMERPPFDFRDADSELVAGWLTESSPPQYALALLLDYLRVFFGSALIAVLFLGGWLGPAIIPAIVWIMIKITAIAFLVMLIRAIMVRTRIDKLLRLGWIYLLPLSVLNLILTFAIFIR